MRLAFPGGAARARAAVVVRAAGGPGPGRRHRTLSFDSYKKDLYGDHGYPGTTSVTLEWDGDQSGADGFYDMCKDFCMRRESFENLRELHLDCPHLPLDGRFVHAVSRHRPRLQVLAITCWAFAHPRPGMWDGKAPLAELRLDLSDGARAPDGPARLLAGAPRVRALDLANSSAEHPDIDAAELALALGSARILLTGFSVRGAAAAASAGAELVLRDCLTPP